ncbi:MAG: Gfo/Idh/MocA family oxidoreductase [Planctomycetes bacterium]|nr:Gfo/Idh/MocA family oxidoreductase [Planctomycetota bacterium]
MPVARRQFLARTAALGVAPLVVPASALGAEGTAPPSSRIGLGFIGVGAMGSGHLRCCTAYPDVQIVAACDVDRWRRERAEATAEDAYATQGRPARCDAHNDLRELLARSDIDAVVIATGDRWHGLATVLAAQAGKDIYCEKPISLTIAEAQAMVAAVRRYARVCQIGLQQRSTPEFIRACQLVRAGALGTIRIVYVNMAGTCDDVSLPAEPVPEGLDWDLWLGPAPWRPYNRRFHPYGQWHGVVPWHFCRDFGGGNLTSNTVHAFDVVQWGLGMDASGPVEIIPPETGRAPLLTYRYASGVLCQVVHDRLPRQREFRLDGWDEATPVQNFGAVFVGDAGWVHVGREGYLRSQPEDIVRQHHLPPGDAHPVNNHHQDWFNCIRARRRPACDVAVGARSTTVSHLGCIAHWLARPLRWDPAREEFVGEPSTSLGPGPEANRLRSRPMRQPWQI